MRSIPKIARSIAAAIFVVALAVPALAGKPGGDGTATVKVECSRSSGPIQIDITNHRKIGAVVLEIRNAAGQSLYREEGKAMSTELVRRLDKGVFPKGKHTLTVTARDFSITQQLVIE